MKKINQKMSLRDFAITIAALLKEKDIDVVLTGGAVVSIYSEGKYVSKDADFLSATDHQTIKQTMLNAGFKNLGKDFYHDDTQFTAEFPGSELIIGDEPMKPEGKIKEGVNETKLWKLFAFPPHEGNKQQQIDMGDLEKLFTQYVTEMTKK